MIFDDDFAQFKLPNKKTVRVPLHKIGITSWPPPEIVTITGTQNVSPVYKRVSYSTITDAERKNSKRAVMRGALYEFSHNEKAMTGPGEGKTVVLTGDGNG